MRERNVYFCFKSRCGLSFVGSRECKNVKKKDGQTKSRKVENRNRMMDDDDDDDDEVGLPLRE
jgi:hypothetical protein